MEAVHWPMPCLRLAAAREELRLHAMTRRDFDRFFFRVWCGLVSIQLFERDLEAFKIGRVRRCGELCQRFGGGSR